VTYDSRLTGTRLLYCDLPFVLPLEGIRGASTRVVGWDQAPDSHLTGKWRGL
jgi:hypothetical protein